VERSGDRADAQRVAGNVPAANCVASQRIASPRGDEIARRTRKNCV
jgi:hypothetical protein